MENLRAALNLRGWSQAVLAKKAESSNAMISSILSGDRRPSRKLRSRIARALRVRQTLLFAEVPRAK